MCCDIMMQSDVPSHAVMSYDAHMMIKRSEKIRFWAFNTYTSSQGNNFSNISNVISRKSRYLKKKNRMKIDPIQSEK